MNPKFGLLVDLETKEAKSKYQIFAVTINDSITSVGIDFSEADDFMSAAILLRPDSIKKLKNLVESFDGFFL